MVKNLSSAGEASLLEFLHTGQLGPLQMHMSRYKVRKLLGKPEWTFTLGVGDALWGYGNLEVGFESKTLDSINMMFQRCSYGLPQVLGVE